MHLVEVKKNFDKCVFWGWVIAVYILLAKINNGSTNYIVDEQIKRAIKNFILLTDPNKKLKLIIYYNEFKTSNLFTIISPSCLEFCKE